MSADRMNRAVLLIGVLLLALHFMLGAYDDLPAIIGSIGVGMVFVSALYMVVDRFCAMITGDDILTHLRSNR